MKTIDLIAKLQALIIAHEPCKEMMGEHEIVIDVFKHSSIPSDHTFAYMGFSPDIKIEKSADGCYDILSAFEVGQ